MYTVDAPFCGKFDFSLMGHTTSRIPGLYVNDAGLDYLPGSLPSLLRFLMVIFSPSRQMLALITHGHPTIRHQITCAAEKRVLK